MSSVFSPSSFPDTSPPPRHRRALSPSDARWPSEEEVHREHRDALEATLLEPLAPADELIFELENGQLRLRPSRR